MLPLGGGLQSKVLALPTILFPCCRRQTNQFQLSFCRRQTYLLGRSIYSLWLLSCLFQFSSSGAVASDGLHLSVLVYFFFSLFEGIRLSPLSFLPPGASGSWPPIHLTVSYIQSLASSLLRSPLQGNHLESCSLSKLATWSTGGIFFLLPADLAHGSSTAISSHSCSGSSRRRRQKACWWFFELQTGLWAWYADLVYLVTNIPWSLLL